MAVRIIVGLIALLAIVEGLAPDAIPSGIVALALVILGLVYAAVAGGTNPEAARAAARRTTAFYTGESAEAC